MNLAFLRFHSTLKDFFPQNKAEGSIEARIKDNPSIKHLFESLGVPHVEVDRIVANLMGVNSSYRVQGGDQIDLYPVQPGSSAPQLLQTLASGALPGEQIRFILDNHLGKLSDYLRLLGFDTLYRNDFEDAELALISAQENRTLLTRDRRLLMRSIVNAGYWVRSTNPRTQVVEILGRYRLSSFIQPFRRCIRCNGCLHRVEKEHVLHQLEPLTKLYYDEFHQCEECKQVYWQGSHFTRAQEMIQNFLSSD